MLARGRCNWLLGHARPRKGFSAVRGKLGTPNAPPHETRLAHLPSKRHHDLAMRLLDDELAESSFAFPNRQGPELPLAYPRQ